MSNGHEPSDADHSEAPDEQRFAEPTDNVKRRNIITGLLIFAVILTIMTIAVVTRLTGS